MVQVKQGTFLNLYKAVFKALNKLEAIDFVDTPADIRDKYQNFAEAKLEKLKGLGRSKSTILG